MLFVTVSVIYRPIEQLLSRTIADRRARGLEHDHPLRTPLLLQGGFALAFLVIALVFRGPIQDGLFDGSTALYWILFVAVLAYAASYFARGWLAGHQWFGLYGGLVFLEALSRLLFALAVAVGIAHGQTAVALGMAAAPFVSLIVVPLAFARAAGARRAGEARAAGGAVGSPAAGASRSPCWRSCWPSRRCSTPPCCDRPDRGQRGRAGFVFNVLLIARAPLQLFQAIQGSLLPHLAGLEAPGRRAEARGPIRVTVLAIAASRAPSRPGSVASARW